MARGGWTHRRGWRGGPLVVAWLCGLLWSSASTAKQLVRVASFDYYPGIQTSGETTRGFFVDLLQAVAADEGWELRFVPGSWDEGLTRLRAGEVDLVTSVARTTQREAFLDYCDTPLLTVWSEVYAAPGAGIRGIFDLRDQAVALMRGDHNADVFRQHMAGFEIPCRYLELPDFAAVLRAVEQGKVSAGVVNSTFGAGCAGDYAVEPTEIVFNPFPIYFAAPRGQHADLLAALDRHLVAWRGDGGSLYFRRLRHWLGRDVEVRRVLPPGWRGTLVFLGILAMVAVAAGLLLRQRMRLALQQLRESEQRFRVLLDSVATLAVQGYRADGTVIYWNPASEVVYGYTAAEAIGRNLVDLIIPPPLRSVVQRAIREGAESGEMPPAAEMELLHKDGSLVPVFSSHAVVRRAGQPPELYCLDVDLTALRAAEAERAQLQERLRQAQHLESLGLLAGGVAHDFNNQLTVILGQASLLLAAAVPGSQEAADLAEIRDAAERSAALTRQLLAFARRQPIAPQVLDLTSELATLQRMLRRLLGENVTLECRPEPVLWPVFVDPAQLGQVLTNLCVNARDAIAGQGRVCIEAADVNLQEPPANACGAVAAGEYVCLRVRDDGCGIGPELLPRLFEPFFTTKPSDCGTGLGLSMVLGAVEQNGGFLEVQSEAGSGSTFSVYLPRHTGQESMQPTQAAAVGHGQGQTVLLVEDDPGVLRYADRILQQLGYRTLNAASPHAALELLAGYQGPLDLLLTDVVLPEMNGQQLAAAVQQLHPGLPCLYVSGYPAQVASEQGFVPDDVTLLDKPFDAAQLAAALSKLLSPVPGR